MSFSIVKLPLHITHFTPHPLSALNQLSTPPSTRKQLHTPHFLCLSYLRLVASPPRMWRSCLFFSMISRTCSYSPAWSAGRRTDISLCTVDFDIPKAAAVLRTVASCSMIYVPSRTARSSSASVRRYCCCFLNMLHSQRETSVGLGVWSYDRARFFPHSILLQMPNLTQLRFLLLHNMQRIGSSCVSCTDNKKPDTAADAAVSDYAGISFSSAAIKHEIMGIL